MTDRITLILKYGRFALIGISKITRTQARVIISFDQNDKQTAELYDQIRKRGNQRHTNGTTDRVWCTEEYGALTIEVQKPRKPFVVRKGG